MVALKDILTTSGAAGDENFVKVSTFPFQWMDNIWMCTVGCQTSPKLNTDFLLIEPLWTVKWFSKCRLQNGDHYVEYVFKIIILCSIFSMPIYLYIINKFTICDW